MNFYIYLFIILSLVYVKCDEPNYPLNQIYNQTELESFDNTVFISEALNYIFTGSFTGSTQIPDDYDNNTFSALLDGGLQL